MWECDTVSVTLSVQVLLLPWDCCAMGLWHNETVTCLSHSWFCHGTVTRRDCDTISVTLSVPILILSWDCLSRSWFCHGTVTRRDCDTMSVTLSVQVLILSWDCYATRLWQNEKDAMTALALTTREVCKVAWKHGKSVNMHTSIFRLFRFCGYHHEIYATEVWTNLLLVFVCLSSNLSVSWRCHDGSLFTNGEQKRGGSWYSSTFGKGWVGRSCLYFLGRGGWVGVVVLFGMSVLW